MNCLPHCLLRSVYSPYKEAALRGLPAIAVLPILLACLGLNGCNNSRPAGVVPVSGKLTLDGGAWPRHGQITFSPLKPAAGYPTLPASARINDDGSFAITTEIAPGLVPGEYGVAVTCLAESSEQWHDEQHASKSAIAARYRSVMTSGLKVTVAEGAKPIFLTWDIKSK